MPTLKLRRRPKLVLVQASAAVPDQVVSASAASAPAAGSASSGAAPVPVPDQVPSTSPSSVPRSHSKSTQSPAASTRKRAAAFGGKGDAASAVVGSTAASAAPIPVQEAGDTREAREAVKAPENEEKKRRAANAAEMNQQCEVAAESPSVRPAVQSAARPAPSGARASITTMLLPHPVLRIKISKRFDPMYTEGVVQTKKHVFFAPSKDDPNGKYHAWCGNPNCANPKLKTYEKGDAVTMSNDVNSFRHHYKKGYCDHSDGRSTEKEQQVTAADLYTAETTEAFRALDRMRAEATSSSPIDANGPLSVKTRSGKTIVLCPLIPSLTSPSSQKSLHSSSLTAPTCETISKDSISVSDVVKRKEEERLKRKKDEQTHLSSNHLACFLKSKKSRSDGQCAQQT